MSGEDLRAGREFELFADYFQFYLQDEGADGDLTGAWTDAAVVRMLAVAPGTVGVGTVRNRTVPVTLALRDSRHGDDFQVWDHVTEASIGVHSGRLIVAGCTDYVPDAERVHLAPGTYGVRVYYGALDEVSADGLDGNDHYRVELWPGERIEPVILKMWPKCPLRGGVP